MRPLRTPSAETPCVSKQVVRDRCVSQLRVLSVDLPFSKPSKGTFPSKGSSHAVRARQRLVLFPWNELQHLQEIPRG